MKSYSLWHLPGVFSLFYVVEQLRCGAAQPP